MDSKYTLGDNVLLIWSNQMDESLLKPLFAAIKTKVGEQGKVLVENLFRLLNLSHPASYFNVIEFGFIDNEPNLKSVTSDFLNEFMRILKPKGKIYLKKSMADARSFSQQVITNFKFAGFVKLVETNDEIYCEKPNYELGSKIDIKTNEEISANTQKIWKMVTEDWLKDDNDNSDLIDDNALLTEDDLKKPDASSLRVCGTTGKRKACSNCSCGLAQELEKEQKEKFKTNTNTPKSACGNCYLGDAFRCASCPYAGMPAFKPGEKIILDNFSDL